MERTGTDEAANSPRRAAPILSAGVPAAPVDWTAPGADGTAGGGGPATLANGMVLAGAGTRLGAFFVDFFILGCVAVVITLISSNVIPNRTTADAVPAIISAALAIVYFAVAWVGPWAATPASGSRACGSSTPPLSSRSTLGGPSSGRSPSAPP